MAWNDVLENNNGGNKDKVDYLKIESGKMVKIRIMDAEPFSRWVHWMPQHKRSITCGGKDCPICALRKTEKANDEEHKYSMSKRHILHVWNTETKEILLFEGGNNMFKDLANYHTMVGDIRNLEIKIMRSGTLKDTKYTLMPDNIGSEPSAEATKAYEETKLDFAERYTAPKREDVMRLMAGETFDAVFGNGEETAVPAQTVTEADNKEVEESIGF